MKQVSISSNDEATPAGTNGLGNLPHPKKEIAPTAFKPRKLKIVMIGAGWVGTDNSEKSCFLHYTNFASISGIQFAHDVTTRMKDYELEIFEKNPELGGTWYENRYPG